MVIVNATRWAVRGRCRVDSVEIEVLDGTKSVVVVPDLLEDFALAAEIWECTSL